MPPRRPLPALPKLSRPALPKLSRPALKVTPPAASRSSRPAMQKLPQPPSPEGLGLVASVVALAAGGLALGFQLERRLIGKRLARATRLDDEPFFSLRSDGPVVVASDGVRLHTEIDEPDAPDPEALTLVFVHGYALSLDCWHFQRKHFRGVLRQVFYDQRSHGRSDRSTPENCRIPQLADDLARVIAELTDGAPLILIGHSMGGMTIMHLAQTRPELFEQTVRGVALFSTAAGEMANHSPIRAIPGRAFNRIAEPLLTTLNRVPQLVERTRKASSDLGYVVTRRMAFGSDVPASYVEFVSEMLAQTSLDVVADFYPAFAELDEYEAFKVLEKLETLVVGGVEDVITPIDHTDTMVDLLPRTQTVNVPDCGHLGMIEHSGIFNDLLDKLIERARAHMVSPAS